MKYCPNCEAEYRDDVDVCVDCGLPLVATRPIHCPHCEERIVGDAAFCPHCGRLIAPSEPPVACERHPDLAATGICVVCGTAVCGTCAVEEEGKIFCGDDSHIRVHQDYALLCQCATEYEAAMIQSNLAGAGIEAQLFSQRNPMYVLNVGELALVNVMVPKSQVHEAEPIVEALMGAGPAGEEDAGAQEEPGEDR